MLKITPYLGIIVIIVSIGGIFYPKIGYFLLLVFATLLIIAPFRGRWFCGNLCPRGSFVDFWLGPISRKAKIPPFLRSMWFRVPVFIVLMGFMVLEKCIDCGLCQRVCPMQLPVSEIGESPDCIKCARCVDACPKKALHF